MEYLGKLTRHNIALCTFDFSGSGNAEGEFVTLGYYEQEDLRLVVDYLRMDRKIGDLALWGRSMGAVAALLYLGKTIEVKAAVLDSAFKSLKALVEEMAGRNSKIPKFVLTGALKIIGKTIEDKALFSINNINPLKYSVPGLYVPAYFLAALDDELVSPAHSK
jgi:alpha/beta superfamily hydrolase